MYIGEGRGIGSLLARMVIGLEDGCSHEDVARTQREICAFLEDQHKDDLRSGRVSLRFDAMTGVAPHACMTEHGLHGGTATAIVLTAGKHPVHHQDMSDEAWKGLVRTYAEAVGEYLNLPSFSLTFVPCESEDFTRARPEAQAEPEP